MSSSEAPEKVILFLSAHLQGLVDKSEQVEDVAAASETPDRRVSMCLKSAVLVLSHKLLVPWITTTEDIQRITCTKSNSDDNTGEQDSSNTVVAARLLLNRISNICVEFLSNNTNTSSRSETDIALERDDPDRQYAIDATAALVSTRISIAASVLIDGTTTSSTENGFVVFQQLLHQLSQKARSCQQVEVRIAIVRNLHLVMQSRYFSDEIFIKCRSDLSGCLTDICQPSQGTKGQQVKESATDKELLNNLAKDILAFF